MQMCSNKGEGWLFQDMSHELPVPFERFPVPENQLNNHPHQPGKLSDSLYGFSLTETGLQIDWHVMPVMGYSRGSISVQLLLFFKDVKRVNNGHLTCLRYRLASTCDVLRASARSEYISPRQK
jgi:hypothetical protein